MRVSFNKSQQNEEAFFSRNIHRACMFPQCFAVFHSGNIVSSVRVLFQDARQGILTKNPSMRAIGKHCIFSGNTKSYLSLNFTKERL